MIQIPLSVAEFNTFRLLAVKAGEWFNFVTQKGYILIQCDSAFLREYGYI